MDPDEFCREVEAYLCRKNDGHLIRIVGPSFERVSGWAALGIPPKVVFNGIDRYFERYYARGSRRRPVRIDFCEADVLDVFDEWRRAVGVQGSAEAAEPESTSAPARPRPSLTAHLDRTIARLTAARGGAGGSAETRAVLERAVRELDGVRSSAKQARGQPRVELLARLSALDRELLDAVRRDQSADVLEALRREAEAELEPYRARMSVEAFHQGVERSLDRLIRERSGAPEIALH